MLKKKCVLCGKLFSKNSFTSMKDWNNVRKYCGKKCRAIAVGKMNLGMNNARWKGGFIDSNGYKVICVNGFRCYEHRYIMELQLKRKLLSTEHIHHIDKNKLNNNLSNLLLINNKEHSKLHTPKGSLFGIHQVKTTYGQVPASGE